MADVIRLEGRTSRAPRKPAIDAAPHDKAVILLFTGIWYERLDGHTGEGPAKTPLQGSTKKH